MAETSTSSKPKNKDEKFLGGYQKPVQSTDVSAQAGGGTGDYEKDSNPNTKDNVVHAASPQLDVNLDFTDKSKAELFPVKVSDGKRKDKKKFLDQIGAEQSGKKRKKVKAVEAEKSEPRDNSSGSNSGSAGDDKSAAENARTPSTGNGINPSNSYDTLQKLLNGQGRGGQGTTSGGGAGTRAATGKPAFANQPLPQTAKVGTYTPSSGAANSVGNMMGYAQDQLRRLGVPEGNVKAAAAHLVGQAYMESKLNPNLVHDQGTGYGIYGARLDRRAKMLGWLDRNGFARNSPEGQMRYMASEAMTNPAYRATRNILMNANAATFDRDVPIITKNFENPLIVNNRTGAVRGAFNGGATGMFSDTGGTSYTGIDGTSAGGDGSGTSGGGTSGGGTSGGGTSGGGTSGGGSGATAGNDYGVQLQQRQKYGQAERAAEAIAASIVGGYVGLRAYAGEGGRSIAGGAPNYNVPMWGAVSEVANMAGSGFGRLIPESQAGIPSAFSSPSPIGNNFGLGGWQSPDPSGNYAGVTGQAISSAGGSSSLFPMSTGPNSWAGYNSDALGGTNSALSGGGGGGDSKSSKEEGKEGKPVKRGEQVKKRADRLPRTSKDDDKELDKELDKRPPQHGERVTAVGGATVRKMLNLEKEEDEDDSGRGSLGRFEDSLQAVKGGIPRDITAAIPAMESMLMDLPNKALGSFVSALPSQFQSLIPGGLIPGLLNNSPVSLNSLLQMAGGGALGGAAGQIIRSQAGGIPIDSLLTQNLQSIPVSQVFGINGTSLSTEAAGIANVLGVVSKIVLQNSRNGVPLDINSLNQSISVALNSSMAALNIPTQVLGIANQIASNPLGAIMNVAMGGMLSSGSLPILPSNLSYPNAALLSGLSQFLPPGAAQTILSVGQVNGMLPSNVKNLIPQVNPKINGAAPNFVEQNRKAQPLRDPESVQSGNGGSSSSGGGGGACPQSKAAVNKGENWKDARHGSYSEKLSEHYTIGNLTTGVRVCSNHHYLEEWHIPVDQLVENLSLLAVNVLEPLRSEFPGMQINSGFRGKPRGGCGAKPGSDHGYGRAADLSWGGNDKHYEVAMWIKRNLGFKQCILEGTWIHVSFDKGNCKRQCFTIGYHGKTAGFIGSG